MNFENTQNRFMLLSGLNEQESDRWYPIMVEAVSYVRGLVTKKALSESDEQRLDALAGMFAYCKYLIFNMETGSGFKAGELTVYADNDTIRNVMEMWKNELELNSDLVSNSCFVFKRVRN